MVELVQPLHISTDQWRKWIKTSIFLPFDRFLLVAFAISYWLELNHKAICDVMDVDIFVYLFIDSHYIS